MSEKTKPLSAVVVLHMLILCKEVENLLVLSKD